MLYVKVTLILFSNAKCKYLFLVHPLCVCPPKKACGNIGLSFYYHNWQNLTLISFQHFLLFCLFLSFCFQFFSFDTSCKCRTLCIERENLSQKLSHFLIFILFHESLRSSLKSVVYVGCFFESCCVFVSRPSLGEPVLCHLQ